MTNEQIAEKVLTAVIWGVSFGGNELGDWESAYFEGSGGEIARSAALVCALSPERREEIAVIGESLESHLTEGDDALYIDAVAKAIGALMAG